MTKWALNKTLASFQSAGQFSLLILLEGGWRPLLAEFGGVPLLGQLCLGVFVGGR